MQDREPISLGHIWSKDVAGSALPRQPAGLSDVLSRNRDDVLVLRGPYGHRARPVLLATMALAASFGLGWAGALNWPEVANLLGVDRIAHQEAPSPRDFRRKIRRQDRRRSKDGIHVRLANRGTRHGRKHSQAFRRGRSSLACGSVERGFRLPGQYKSGRGGGGDEAAFGAGAGNEADNHSGVDRCRGSGRNRRARGPRRNSDGRARRHDSRHRAN